MAQNKSWKAVSGRPRSVNIRAMPRREAISQRVQDKNDREKGRLQVPQ